MKLITLLCSLAMISCSFVYAAQSSEKEITKTANLFCNKNKECVDVISMELDGMYYQGLNEKKDVTVGTLINRKARSLNSYCEYSKDVKLCESYKNQLMLRYITGLLDR